MESPQLFEDNEQFNSFNENAGNKTLIGHAPDYISDLLTLVADMPSRSSLRASSSSNLFLPRTDAVIRRPLVLCRRAPWVESATDRTETLSLVHNNIQPSPKDILIQHSIHLPLTMECAIGLIVWGAQQMLLLLLL